MENYTVISRWISSKIGNIINFLFISLFPAVWHIHLPNQSQPSCGLISSFFFKQQSSKCFFIKEPNTFYFLLTKTVLVVKFYSVDKFRLDMCITQSVELILFTQSLQPISSNRFSKNFIIIVWQSMENSFTRKQALCLILHF